MEHPYSDVASKLLVDYSLKVVVAYHAGKHTISNEWRDVACPYPEDNQFRAKVKAHVAMIVANRFELLQIKEKALESVACVVPGGVQVPELCKLLWLILARLRDHMPQSQLGILLRTATVEIQCMSMAMQEELSTGEEKEVILATHGPIKILAVQSINCPTRIAQGVSQLLRAHRSQSQLGTPL